MNTENLFLEINLDDFIDHGLIRHKSLPGIMKNAEREVLVWALTQTNGNQYKAAKLLNMKHSTLNNKVLKYDIHIDLSVW
ncbi:hypothetical protein KGY73_10920 [bacterium]|nr:hypothetical protein [bacterium]